MVTLAPAIFAIRLKLLLETLVHSHRAKHENHEDCAGCGLSVHCLAALSSALVLITRGSGCFPGQGNTIREIFTWRFNSWLLNLVQPFFFSTRKQEIEVKGRRFRQMSPCITPLYYKHTLGSFSTLHLLYIVIYQLFTHYPFNLDFWHYTFKIIDYAGVNIFFAF